MVNAMYEADENKEVKAYQTKLARSGGRARFVKYGREAYVEMGRKSGEARKKKKQAKEQDEKDSSQ